MSDFIDERLRSHEILWSISIQGLWSMVTEESPEGSSDKVLGPKGHIQSMERAQRGKISDLKGPFTANGESAQGARW